MTTRQKFPGRSIWQGIHSSVNPWRRISSISSPPGNPLPYRCSARQSGQRATMTAWPSTITIRPRPRGKLIVILIAAFRAASFSDKTREEMPTRQIESGAVARQMHPEGALAINETARAKSSMCLADTIDRWPSNFRTVAIDAPSRVHFTMWRMHSRTYAQAPLESVMRRDRLSSSATRPFVPARQRNDCGPSLVCRQ